MQQSDTNVFHLLRVMELGKDGSCLRCSDEGLRAVYKYTCTCIDWHGWQWWMQECTHNLPLSLYRPCCEFISVCCLFTVALLHWLMEGNYVVWLNPHILCAYCEGIGDATVNLGTRVWAHSFILSVIDSHNVTCYKSTVFQPKKPCRTWHHNILTIYMF